MNSTERRKINFTLLGEPANKYKNPFMNFLYHYHNVNKGGPITKSAKEAGKMWKILSAEEKEKYKKKVAQQEEPDEQQASAWPVIVNCVIKIFNYDVLYKPIVM